MANSFATIAKSTKWEALSPALSICALIWLHCHLVSAISRISPGGDKHVAGHDLCPLCQGASDLCDGPSGLGATPGCPTSGCPLCPHRRATIYPRITVFLLGAADE